MSLRIKRDDSVMVISGANKGAVGRVLQVLPAQGKAVVEGVNMVKKHTKARGQEEPGGIHEQEAAIRLSNLMLVDEKSGAPGRLRARVDENGAKTRYIKTADKEITL